MPKSGPVTADERSMMCALREQHADVKEIAAEMERSPSTVYRVLEEEGMPASETSTALEPDREWKILQRIINKEPPGRIIKSEGISQMTFDRIVSESGVTVQATQSRDDYSRRLDQAVELYQNTDLPMVQISDVTGISNFKINQEMHARRLPLRRARSHKTTLSTDGVVVTLPEETEHGTEADAVDAATPALD